jgi:hypothetical protein
MSTPTLGASGWTDAELTRIGDRPGPVNHVTGPNSHPVTIRLVPRTP